MEQWKRRRRRRDGGVRHGGMDGNKHVYQLDTLTVNVKLSFCCGFVCAGEIPHSTSGEVFVDIDDEEPLVPDQVKPSCQLVG